jgi:hypothetical protein
VRLWCWGGVPAGGVPWAIVSADDITYACSSLIADAARPALVYVRFVAFQLTRCSYTLQCGKSRATLAPRRQATKGSSGDD